MRCEDQGAGKSHLTGSLLIGLYDAHSFHVSVCWNFELKVFLSFMEISLPLVQVLHRYLKSRVRREKTKLASTLEAHRMRASGLARVQLISTYNECELALELDPPHRSLSFCY